MDCIRVREVIFLYTDNELEEELTVAFREHLVDCPPCARQIEYTIRVLGLVRKCCAGTSAPASLRQKILTSLPHRRLGLGE